jgi:predicted ABC-type ATPase
MRGGFQKRFRIFAGPNGSGKSSIIKAIRKKDENGWEIDFGTYVNADEIAVSIVSEAGLNLSNYLQDFQIARFLVFADSSGMMKGEITLEEFAASFIVKNDHLTLVTGRAKDLVAQVLANFFVKSLLELGHKVSYETVFSHASKVSLMEYAKTLGYKVYLYFVCTEAPEINIYRVKLRAERGGHDVDERRIRERYYRSLALMPLGATFAYQAYFFDNSGVEGEFFMVAHFKRTQDGIKEWESLSVKQYPNWFKESYISHDSDFPKS